MRILKIKYIYLLTIGLLVMSCSREDSVEFVEDSGIEYNFTESNTTLNIRVSDGLNYLPQAEVNVSGMVQLTDEKGIAIIKRARKTELGYTVKVSKEGYTTETIFIPFEDDVDYVSSNIIIEARGESGLVVSDEYAGAANSVELGNNVTLEVPANLFGTTQSQDVFFYSRFEATNLELQNQSLLTYKKGQRKIFIPTARFDILAYNSSNQSLQLSDGKELEIELRNESVYQEIIAASNTEVVRRSDISGLYVNESDFNLMDNVATGTISELGTYFFGTERDAVHIQMTLHSANDVRLAYFSTTVLVEGIKTKVTTDRDGRLDLYVPKNTPLNIGFSQCAVAEELSIEGQESDVNLGILKTSFNNRPIVGAAQDCNTPEAIEGYGTRSDEVIAIIEESGNIVGNWICETGLDTFRMSLTNVLSNTTVTKVVSLQASNDGSIDLGLVEISCIQLALYCGNIFFDADDDGIAESQENINEFINGFVTLTPVGGTVGLEKTTPILNGNYCFSLVPLGTYEVTFNLSAAAQSSGLIFYNVDGFHTPVIDDGEPSKASFITNIDIVFPNGDIFFNRLEPGSISGSTFWDTNGDGLANIAHDGLKVFLHEDNNRDGVPDSEIANTVAGADGQYSFSDIKNGSYVLRVDPAGYEGVSDNDDSPDDAFDILNSSSDFLIPVFVQRAESDGDNNFVLKYENLAGTTADISGAVLLDTNDDGIGDEGLYQEILLLNLRDAEGLPISSPEFAEMNASTALDGSFGFDNIPDGEYVITLTSIAGSSSIGPISAVSDKDESPEPGEPLDTDPANGLILVNMVAGQMDMDNIFVVKAN